MLTKRKWTPAKVFCLIAALGMAVLALSLVLSEGDVWHRIFWFDYTESYYDTGMDFFHSIEYLKGNDPYGHWNTIYPPLANLLFKGLYRMVPPIQKEAWTMDFMDSVSMRATSRDLRVWMPTLMIYILTFILTAVLAFAIIAAYYRKKKQPAAATAFCALFSYGLIYAVERGNIIIPAMAAALFFVLFRNDEDARIRELSLILLAVSANLKLYPALLGLLLLQEKKWKEAARAVLYGVLLFVLPCFAFEGGLANIPLVIRNTLGVANRVAGDNVGTSFDKLLFSLNGVLLRLTGREMLPVLRAAGKLNMLCLILGIGCSFAVRKNWQKSLSLILAFILFSNQGIYVTCFLTIPLVQFLAEEERFTKRNIVPFIGLALGIVCLPVFNGDGGFSRISFRLQIALAILLGCVLVSAVCAAAQRRRPGGKTAVKA